MKQKRYQMLDSIRGFALISMILYHGMYDIVYLFGHDILWYQSTIGYIWQQSICWTFILLSGMCWQFSKHPFKRGIKTFLAGLIITVVTIIFIPQERVLYGILTLIGVSTLAMIPLEKLIGKCNPYIGLFVNSILFFVSKNINNGYLGFESMNFIKLPQKLYEIKGLTFLGFPSVDFYSSDYFSFFPWFFLFLAGYYLWNIIKNKDKITVLLERKISGFEWIGKKSILIYLLHQPIIMIILQIMNQ